VIPLSVPQTIGGIPPQLPFDCLILNPFQFAILQSS